MIASQLLTTPLSMLVSAVLGRRLGAADFGALYLAQTAVGVGFLVVDWGQSLVIAGAVARDRHAAERLLGTSVLLKLGASVLATALLFALGFAQGYSPPARLALIFLSLTATASAVQASGAAVLRGYEKLTQVSALALATNVASSLLVMSLALLGYGFAGVLWATLAAAVLMLLPAALLLRRSGVGPMKISRDDLRLLLGRGSPFLLFNLVLALQPYIDGAFLARLSTPEVIGWQAATRRIAGVLIFPAVSLSFVMYPALVRLHHEAPARAVEMMREALRWMALAGVPVALLVMLFTAPMVHAIYGAGNFEGTILSLQLLAPYLLLVYFTIVIGNWLLAAEKVLAWSGVQALCILVSAATDAPLILYFQRRMGNGAAGISVSTLASELLMVARAMLRGGLLRAIVSAAIAGAAMAGVARLLAGAASLLAVAASLAVYLAVLVASGALKRADLQSAIAMVRMRGT